MSQFLDNPDSFVSANSDRIDFDAALRLAGGGTTCDLYRTRWQRREVFVKRLKEEFRSKPLYLDALDKEFDVGVGLHHPALPEYREFHRDYIIMDFIDGETLAEMIRRDDPWLANERHIRKLLTQLVDVVDYLHRHNVVHCDIKPDNIIITANSKNLVLIDFDKSYTDSLNDTSGSPARYGVAPTEKGRPTIDFHGIAMVLERLRNGISGFRFREYKRFLKACQAPDANCETLAEILSAGSTRVKKGVGILLMLAGVIAIVLLVRVLTPDVSNDGNILPQLPTADTILPSGDDSIAVGDVRPEPAAPAPKVAPEVAPEVAPKVAPEETPEETPEQRVVMIVAALDYGLAPYFNGLTERLDRLDQLRRDTTLTHSQLKRHWDSYGALEKITVEAAMEKAIKLCPDVADHEIGDYISATDHWRIYRRRAREVKSEFITEMDRRRSAQ